MKKINQKQLNELLDTAKTDTKKVLGIYHFKEYRIVISKSGEPITDKVKRLYYDRKAQGLCVKCGGKLDKNKRTGKKYSTCPECREKILKQTRNSRKKKNE